MYEDYYLQQSGNGLPIFHGSRGQRGHGLGSMLSGLFRSAFPMIKRGLANFGKHALKTGLEIANDVADGSSFKESAQSRVFPAIKRFAQSDIFSSQSGSGRRRRKISLKRKIAKRQTRSQTKRQKKDIFD
jgi:hypothetical protein